jgi:hypothetical protein
VRLALIAGLAVAALVAGAARAALLRGTEGSDRLVGTPAADTIYGLGGADTIDGRGGADVIVAGPGRDSVQGGTGDDRIAVQDGAVDNVTCGPGLDTVTADLADKIAPDCETVSRQLSRDTTSDYYAEHETQVEPSSFAWGKKVVAAFQSGRIANGGAAAIAFATSADAGAHWRSGVLPQGDYAIVSDSVVAYDSVHGRWLVAALGAGSGLFDVYVVRSRDGLTWSAPIAAVRDVNEDYDKEWLACDNGKASRFRGTCYLAYVDTRTQWLAIRRSTDGGVTWSASVRMQPGIVNATFSGPMPVVRPNGDVVVPYALYAPISGGEDRMAAVISHDGGATFSAPVRIARLEYTEGFDVRAPAMPSVAADTRGKLYAVWADSHFRDDGTSTDVVLSSSADETTWTAPVKLPLGESGTVLEFIPAVAVDPATSGKTAHLAVAYYTMKLPARCALFVPGCAEQLDAWLVESKTGGASWSKPRRLNTQSMLLDWLADTTLGPMVGDYIAVSYAGGRPIAFVSLAEPPPSSYELSQAVFAAKG